MQSVEEARVEDEAPDAAPPEEGPKFITRETFLAAGGKLAEETLFVEGLGNLLLREVSAGDRADMLSKSLQALQREQVDVKGYQRALLLVGVVDPASPPDDRQPLFKPADMDAVMRVGGKKLLPVVDVIERLSLMGKYQPGAEDFSAKTLSSGRTSA